MIYYFKFMNYSKIRIAFTFLVITITLATYANTPRKGFFSNKQASKWEESLVSGNGNMGVMVEGNPYNENIVVNHAQIFLPINDIKMPPSQGKHLDTIRNMMLDGKYKEASQFVVDLANSEGYKVKHATDPYIPAFKFKITSDSLPIENYSRGIDFESGEINVKWSDANGNYKRNTFVSRTDSIVVMRIKAYKGRINSTLSIEDITTFDEKRHKKFRMNSKHFMDVRKIHTKDKLISYRAKFEKPQHFGDFIGYNGYEGIAKIVKCDGKVACVDNKLQVRDATELLLLLKVEMCKEFDNSNLKKIEDHLDNVDDDYNNLLKSHKKIHGDLFNRTSLNLYVSEEERNLPSEELFKKGGKNKALIERLFAAARYNVLSATGTHAPNLQGIWGASLTPNWSGDFTTNGNLPVAISHYLQSNTPELMMVLFDQIDKYRKHFQTNARVLFGCNGIHIPSHFTMHGLDNHFDATWPMTFWVAGAPWYAMFYYDYYLYTQDKEFLRNRALPFMEESAKFFEEFLQIGTDGKYIINPSYSPENRPLNSNSQACINATMDVMAINGLLRFVIEASETLGINKDKIVKWKAMQDKMPPYELNKDGELREWLWKDLQDNHEHRHASHLLGLYDYHDPLIMNNPEIKEGCRKVIKKRMQFRRKENTGVMAFGICQLAFSAAALGETDMVEEMLGWLSSNYWNINMFSTHDPHRIFNCDISGGYPSLVMKMLCYSEPGVIELLPAKPKSWNKGKIEGMALRGGIIMQELAWDNDNIQLRLQSSIDQRIKIYHKDKYIKEIELKKNKSYTLKI